MIKRSTIDQSDDDFEFDFESPRRKPIVHRGRRSESSLSSSRSNSGFNIQENLQTLGSASPTKAANSSILPGHSKKTGVWGEDNSSSKMSWLRRVSRSSPSKGSPTKDMKASHDSDNEIPSIPDLDEAYEEELASQMAHAPSVAVHKVMTYQELDNDLTRSAAFQILDGVDLRLLTKHLEPENKIQEDDISWAWDVLFTDIASQQAEAGRKIDLKAGLSTDD